MFTHHEEMSPFILSSCFTVSYTLSKYFFLESDLAEQRLFWGGGGQEEELVTRFQQPYPALEFNLTGALSLK